MDTNAEDTPRRRTIPPWMILLLAMIVLGGLFAFPGLGLYHAPWFLFILLAWLLLLWRLLAERDNAAGDTETAGPRMIAPDEQPSVVREVMDVRLAEEDHGVQVFRGDLRGPAARVFERLRQAFSPSAVPLLQADARCEAAILVMPRPVERAALERPGRPWLNGVLLLLTLLTTTWAGAAQQGVNLLQEPGRFAVGLPYSLALMAVLGVHELGHYVAARRHRMRVTLPYFIPVPFALGTFGAFIQMKSPAEDRCTLFDVAVSGPLAGLVVAIPALIFGLQYSEVLPPDAVTGLFRGTAAESSILFALLAKLSLGDALQYGCTVRLGPVAFAGWLGLFITGLNLIPVGQLDGGHLARAMFGTRAGSIIGTVALLSLLALALFVWPGLLVWVLLIYFIAGRGTPPLNDLTPITAARRWIGYLAFAILVMVMVPVPDALTRTLGINCPYL